MNSLIQAFENGTLKQLQEEERKACGVDEAAHQQAQTLRRSIAEGGTWLDNPPNDGRQYDCQCARCGSSIGWENCEQCGGDGYDGHDCGEDCCCCLEPEENMVCNFCEGEGSYSFCLSSREWCEANPLPDREGVMRGRLEWYCTGE